MRIFYTIFLHKSLLIIHKTNLTNYKSKHTHNNNTNHPLKFIKNNIIATISKFRCCRSVHTSTHTRPCVIVYSCVAANRIVRYFASKLRSIRLHVSEERRMEWDGMEGVKALENSFLFLLPVISTFIRLSGLKYWSLYKVELSHWFSFLYFLPFCLNKIGKGCIVVQVIVFSSHFTLTYRTIALIILNRLLISF